MTCRRTDTFLREFVDLVIGRVHAGMTIDRAAELMLEHKVPQHVVANVLGRIQQTVAREPA